MFSAVELLRGVFKDEDSPTHGHAWVAYGLLEGLRPSCATGIRPVLKPAPSPTRRSTWLPVKWT